MKKYSVIFSLISVVSLSFLAVIPFLNQGFFPIHDNTQVARVFEMMQSLKDGLFPVRWVQDLGYGYGYPIFSFYAPLSYYIGAGFMFLGLNALDATKVMIVVGFLSAGITMYFLAREFFEDWISILVSLLYVYAPYHAVNTYVRGAIGELWAYALIPLAFLGFFLVSKKPSWRTLALAAVGYAGVICSHNLTALLITPFLLIGSLLFLIQGKWEKRKVVATLLAFLFSFTISAWYWLPAVGEMGYTNVQSVAGGGSAYKDHFVCLSQLWSSQWGFGGSTQGCLDGLSFQLGKLHILLGIIAIVVIPLIPRVKRFYQLLFVGGAVISVFFMLDVSKMIWDLFPFMKYVQFPWRFTQLAVFFLSLLAGFSLYALSSRLSQIKYSMILRVCFALIIIVSTMTLYLKVFKPQFFDTNYRDETKKETLLWTVSKISDEYLPKNFKKPRSESTIPKTIYQRTENLTVQQVSRSTDKIELLVKTKDRQQLILNLAYFPAWEVRIDNRRAEFSIVDGHYHIEIPAGEHRVDVTFHQTPLEKLANTVSVIGIVVLLLGIIKKNFLKL